MGVHHDPDDLFADSRMSLGDHLEDLRLHLWRAVAGLGIAVVLSFVLDFVGQATGLPIGVGKPVQDFITRPAKQQLEAFYERRAERVLQQLLDGDPAVVAANAPRDVPLEVEIIGLSREVAARLGLPSPEPSDVKKYVLVEGRIPPILWVRVLREAQQLVIRRAYLTTLNASEGMMVYFKMTLVCGVILASPWIFWQLWSFVALGLYPHEKRPLYRFLPFSLGLFLAGVLVCQFLVLPRALEAMLWFNEWLDYEPDLRLSDWLGFAVWMPLVFGLSFQTPLVMLLLERLGIFDVSSFRSARRTAWFLLAIFAGVISPSADYVSLLYLWVPLGLLYELGLLLCRWSPQRDFVQ